MKCNIGWVERTVRIMIALPTLTAPLYVRHYSVLWSWVLIAMGVWLLLTAALRWCPVSALMGRSTAEPSQQI